MILECGHCGAPLDVRDQQVAYRCRYCGHSSRIEQTRTLMPQTPSEWRPPPTWRPPAHVPADSNQELRYQGGGGSPVLGAILLVALVLTISGAIAAGIVSARKNGGNGNPFSNYDPEKLDTIAFNETLPALRDKIGGGTASDNKWLNVKLGGPFDYAVFQWDDKDLSHPSGVSIHASDRSACTPELEAIRTKLRNRLGSRFDGKSWRWGPAHLNFDEKCSSVSFGVFLGSPIDDVGDWKHQTEALWKMIRTDVFGRVESLNEEDVRTFLAKGYDVAKVGKAVSKSTIDDAESLRKKFPAIAYRKTIGLDGELPLDHPRFGSVRLSWNNSKGGPLSSVDLTGYANKLPDHVEVAKCIAKKMGVALEVKETDYMNKKTDASFRVGNVYGHVGEYGARIYSGGLGTLGSDNVESFMNAAASCK